MYSEKNDCVNCVSVNLSTDCHSVTLQCPKCGATQSAEYCTLCSVKIKLVANSYSPQGEGMDPRKREGGPKY